jgi:hypothetical protein
MVLDYHGDGSPALDEQSRLLRETRTSDGGFQSAMDFVK